MKFDITRMLNADVYDHPVDSIELIETHISWVLLTGTYAYKIKKPVNFGFLDFSTLDKRKKYCDLELRLNRRLAPAIYLDVVLITGSFEQPRISASGAALEYAVKMRQFPQSAQLDHRLESGELNPEHMDAIAVMVAEFHQSVDVADAPMEYGSNTAVFNPVVENFIQIDQHSDTRAYQATLSELKQWSESQFARLETVFTQRKRDGFIRECHGDMHLRNMLWLDDVGPVAFDCIEFNPALRWIDVISEVAFLVMDLQDRRQQQLANRFLNSYLEVTGDYAGLSVMAFYLCYRALVRAKVDVLRLDQKNVSQQETAGIITEFESYLELALSYTGKSSPKLMLMRGVSGSGKTTVSRMLVDTLGAIRIRSDVERKRMFDIAATEHAASQVDSGIYTQQASQKTYAKLVELATHIIAAGYSAIVDAALLQPEQILPFQTLAEDSGIACIIIETIAPVEVLRERIVKRKGDASDAGLAVLEHQLADWQPLDESETGSVISLDTSDLAAMNTLPRRINAISSTSCSADHN
jgi:hypothetical protein